MSRTLNQKEKGKMKEYLQHIALIVPFVIAILLGACAGSPTPTAPMSTAPTTVPTSSSTPTPAAAPTAAAALTAVEQLTLESSQNAKVGNILTDAQGMTLYVFKNDRPDTSTCTGDCATQWPPLTIAQGVTPVADKGVSGNIGVIERADKTYQVAFNDAPLYRSSGDKAPGDVNGSGVDNLWYPVTLPAAIASMVPAPAGAPTDWSTHGFPTVLGSQLFDPGTGVTLTFGPYSIQVPNNAFATPVKFVVLSGDPKTFEAPTGQAPILAFAFNVSDAKTNQLVDKFDNPVIVTVIDPKIVAPSAYYNVAPDGTLSPNDAGLFVQAGSLVHPIAGTTSGWVITAPASAAQ